MKKIRIGKKDSSSDEHNIKSLLRKNRIWLYYVIYDRRDFELFQCPKTVVVSASTCHSLAIFEDIMLGKRKWGRESIKKI